LKYVFDTEAILKFYLGEEGAPKVLELLKRVQDKKVEGYISIINLTNFITFFIAKAPI
jgi:PIN domain nuclease of toxin-antitoxin system